MQIIWDRHDFDMSIKADERQRRGQCSENSPEIKVNSYDHVMPTYIRTFLSNPKSKDNFNNFAFNEIASYYQLNLSIHRNLVLVGGFTLHERAVLVHAGEIKDVQVLYCNHEEADTIIWFHVNDSIERFGISNIVVSSPDSVVFILGL